MEASEIKYKPVEGKTYSLFGPNQTTEFFYKSSEKIINQCLEFCESPEGLLVLLQKSSQNKRFFNNLQKGSYSELYNYLHQIFQDQLSLFTANTKEHLKKLPIAKKIFDRRLKTNELQYHLYILEIELINRIYKEAFKNSIKKIALLPHCLRDIVVGCKASMGDLDYTCKNCKKDCFINHSSKLLKKYDIDPYIWMTMDLKKMKNPNSSNTKQVGVLGIACIPELVWGMRYCQKRNIPAIGIPLDANRCVRWMGNFYENSLNIGQLEKLIS